MNLGEFVFHCHILDHEDHGMMFNVAIVQQGALGGASAFNASGGVSGAVFQPAVASMKMQ